MYINKSIFMEYDEVSKLPTAIYNTIVRETDYGHSEILADVVNDLLIELDYDRTMADENEKSHSFTKEEFEEACKNILGEAYDMLLDGRIDFISVIYN